MELSKYWNVKDSFGMDLTPRVYSSGISQEDVVKQIIKRFKTLSHEQNILPDEDKPIKKKPKICILKGYPGTGKSLIALNVAKLFDKSLFVVPTKNLQHQYEIDYSSDESKKIIKNDGNPLSIKVLKGRDNFRCIYGEDSYSGGYTSAASEINPCTMPTQASRIQTAKACPFWSPVFNTVVNTDNLDDVREEKYYDALSGDNVQYIRDNNCGYYKQFTEFIDSDVGILNIAMFDMEMSIGRLPKRDLLVIDEFDFFLDSVRSEIMFTSNKLKNVIEGKHAKDISLNTLEKLRIAIDKFNNAIENDEEGKIKPLLSNSNYIDFLKTLSLEEMKSIKGIKKDSFRVDGILYLMEYVYYLIEKNEKGTKITFFVLDLKAATEKIFENFEYILGMSATLQDKGVLSQIYGLTPDTYGGNFIVSEKSFLGTVKLSDQLPESELMAYNNATLRGNRTQFHKTLSKCLDIAKDGKTLFHITSYADLPSKTNNEHKYNLPYSEDIREDIQQDKNGEMLLKFKDNYTDVLFSTKDLRGTDLPDDLCRYIIFPKVPYMYMKEPFLVALEQKNKSLFWMYYSDKMQRELLQGVCRGLRSDKDYVTILSPDLRVHNIIKKYIQMKENK